VLSEAFRDLHGSRLHGFALLLTLGDSRLAAQAAGEALAAGAEHARALRHPERAAAWLRARVLHAVRRRGGGASEASKRMSALAPLGVERRVYDGLAALPIRSRAALVASAIERFEAIDVETIVDADAAGAQRLTEGARARYLAVAGTPPSGQEAVPPAGPEGPLAARVRSVAARAMTADRSSP